MKFEVYRDEQLPDLFTSTRPHNSIGKIRTSPLWNREDCVDALR